MIFDGKLDDLLHALRSSRRSRLQVRADKCNGCAPKRTT
jgi:hypothetical protein